MKKTILSRLYIAAALAVGLVSPLKMLGANNETIIKLPTQHVTLPAEKLKPVARPPIPYRSIEMADPKTGKIFAPTDLITARNGIKVPASQFFAELNRVERLLNAQGLSLRNGIPAEQAKAAGFRQHVVANLVSERISVAERQRQPAVSPTAPGVVRSDLAKRMQSFRFDRDALHHPAGRANILRYAPGFTERHGDPDVLSFRQDVGVTVLGHPAELDLSFNRRIQVSLFGYERVLMDQASEMTARAGRLTQRKSHLSVLGTSLQDENVAVANSSPAGSFVLPAQRIVDWSVDFPVASFPAAQFNGTVGLRGTVGAKGSSWGLNQPPALEIEGEQIIDIKAYGGVGLDTFLVWAGVRAELTLLDDKLTHSGTAASIGRDVYWWHDGAASEKVVALKGRIYAYCCFETGVLDSTCLTLDLFEWDGLSTERSLWNPDIDDLPLYRGPS